MVTPLLLLVVAWFWAGLQLWGTHQCNPGVDPELYPDCRTSTQTWGAVLVYLGALLPALGAVLGAWWGRRTDRVWLGLLLGVFGFAVMLVVGGVLMD